MVIQYVITTTIQVDDEKVKNLLIKNFDLGDDFKKANYKEIREFLEGISDDPNELLRELDFDNTYHSYGEFHIY